jgi:hypothetical protein
MIAVKRVRKPARFNATVKIPGDAWLAANPLAKRPKPLWTPFTPKLSAGFDDLCGYAAMHDPTGGTVDHFLSFRNRRDLAYEWGNYRFASAPLNSSKKFADADVLDPYEVGDGWFEVLLPSLQLRVTAAVPAALKAKAEYTLKRLQLRDGERIIRWRKSWYDMYCAGMLTLDGLKRVAPLLAQAVEKQNASAAE